MLWCSKVLLLSCRCIGQLNGNVEFIWYLYMRISGLFFVAALAGVSAFAGENYVQLGGGVSYVAPSSNNDGVFSGSAGKAKPVMGVELWHKFDGNFRLGLSVEGRSGYVGRSDWMSFDPEIHDGGGYAYGVMHGKVRVNALSAMVVGRYDLTEFAGLSPYLIAGIGAARSRINALGGQVGWRAVDASNPKVYESIDGAECERDKQSTSSFAYKLGAGFGYALTERVSLDLRYQFADLGKVKYQDPYRTISSRLRVHESLIGLSYKF